MYWLFHCAIMLYRYRLSHPVYHVLSVIVFMIKVCTNKFVVMIFIAL